jgi:hypothetical protein
MHSPSARTIDQKFSEDLKSLVEMKNQIDVVINKMAKGV